MVITAQTLKDFNNILDKLWKIANKYNYRKDIVDVKYSKSHIVFRCCMVVLKDDNHRGFFD